MVRSRSGTPSSSRSIAARKAGGSCMWAVVRYASAAAVQGEHGTVDVRPTVAEHAPVLAVAADLVEVEAGGDDRLLVLARLRHFGAEMVGDEGGAVETLPDRLR